MLQGEHSSILSTFIKLPFAIKTFVLSIFEWPLKTGFTVHTFYFSAVDSFAIDWLTWNWYFTDFLIKRVSVCSADGSLCSAIVTNQGDTKLYGPKTIALNPYKR